MRGRRRWVLVAIASALLIASVAPRLFTQVDSRPSVPQRSAPTADAGRVSTDVVVTGNDSTLALQAAIDAGDLARFKVAIRRLGVHGVTCHADGIAVACSAADSRFAAGWTFVDPRSG